MSVTAIFSVTAPYLSNAVEIRVGARNGDGSLAIARPIVFEDSDEGSYVPPTLITTREVAQQLMDRLWEFGLRPTEGNGSAGALAATQQHLQDMRQMNTRLLDAVLIGVNGGAHES